MVFSLKVTALILGVVAFLILSNDGVYAAKPASNDPPEKIAEWVCGWSKLISFILFKIVSKRGTSVDEVKEGIKEVLPYVTEPVVNHALKPYSGDLTKGG